MTTDRAPGSVPTYGQELLEPLRLSVVAGVGCPSGSWVRGAFLVIPLLSFIALGQDLAELY